MAGSTCGAPSSSAGVLLLLGVLTRFAAAPMMIVMLVATIAAKSDRIDFLETLLGFDEVTYFVMFAWLAIAGPARSRSSTWC